MGHSRGRAALVAVALCLAAVGEAPASPANEAPAITWKEIKELAARHPALPAAAGEAEEAAAEVRTSKQYPNPVLGFEMGRAEAIDGGEEEGIWALELKLPILPIAARRAETRAAEAEHGAALEEVEAVRLRVLGELKESFLRVAHDQEHLRALRASADQLSDLVDVARKRVEMGEARPMELNRLQIEAARVDLALSEARERLRARKRVLRLWLGSTLPEHYRVEADLGDLPELPTIDDAVDRAVSGHPEVGSAGLRLRAATARVRAERGSRFPRIEVGGFYEEELDARNFGGSLELSVPLWNWNSGGISRARAAEATARHRLNVRLTEIEAATRESHAAALSAYARADAFRDAVLPKAVEVAGAMERMYEIGEADVMNVLDARRRLIEIESELLETYLRCRLAYLRLATLMGDSADDGSNY